MERKLFKLTTKEEPKLYSKEELWIAVEKFVYKLCNKYVSIETFSEPFDEILSIALISFTKAYKSYDISKVTFLSYLSSLIRNDVLMEYRYNKDGKIYYNKKRVESSMEEHVCIDTEGNEVTLLDVIANRSNENNVYNYIENKEIIKNVNFCINNILSEKEKIVFYYRLKGLTQQKIADILELSRSYISGLELKGCKKIRNYLKKNKII